MMSIFTLYQSLANEPDVAGQPTGSGSAEGAQGGLTPKTGAIGAPVFLPSQFSKTAASPNGFVRLQRKGSCHV
jgi:hypothetical protein